MYLNIHSYYSLRYGTIAPKQLVSLVKQHNIRELVLTDINSTTACLDIIRLAKKEGIKPILGVDFRDGAQQKFILIAQNKNGYLHINNYLSEFLHLEDFSIPKKAKTLPNTYVIYPFTKDVFELKKTNL